MNGYDERALRVLGELLPHPGPSPDALQDALAPILRLRIPWDTLALQDAANLAEFLIRTTIEAQTLTAGLRDAAGRSWSRRLRLGFERCHRVEG